MDSKDAGLEKPKKTETTKQEPLLKQVEGIKINTKQTIITTIGVAVIVGVSALFISKKSIGITIASTLIGAAAGFLIDAKVQKMKS